MVGDAELVEGPLLIPVEINRLRLNVVTDGRIVSPEHFALSDHRPFHRDRCVGPGRPNRAYAGL